MTALRMLPPKHYIGAVEAIPGIVPLVERLRDAGAAYELDGDIYFSVEADPHFGEVSRLDAAAMRVLSAERGGDPERPGQEEPARPDAVDGGPSGRAELGRRLASAAGRPGWHIECVAIALDHLGMGFDVQGGGSDLAFPHHEMGASHAQVLTGEHPFAKAYVHAGMVGLDGEKMSKSKGNLVFVSTLRQRGRRPGRDPARAARPPLPRRTGSGPTRSSPTRGAAGRWRAAVSRPDGPSADALVEEVRAALADDLDAPAALAAVDRWAARCRSPGAARTRARPAWSRARSTRCWAWRCEAERLRRSSAVPAARSGSGRLRRGRRARSVPGWCAVAIRPGREAALRRVAARPESGPVRLGRAESSGPSPSSVGLSAPPGSGPLASRSSAAGGSAPVLPGAVVPAAPAPGRGCRATAGPSPPPSRRRPRPGPGPGRSPSRRRYRSNSRAIASPDASGSSAVSRASSSVWTYSATSLSSAASWSTPTCQARASSGSSPSGMRRSIRSSSRLSSASVAFGLGGCDT